MAVCFAVTVIAQQLAGPGSLQMRGSVLDPEGRPIPSALVQITSGGGAAQTTVTNGLGQFSVNLSGPGPYEATVTTAFGSEHLSIPGQILQDVVIRVQNAFNRPPADAAAATVSLNDLEAPHKAKAKLQSAEKAVNKSDLAKAWRLVNDAIRIAPQWGRAYLLRGVLSFTNHNYASAQSDFATAIAHDPHNSLALTEMGKLNTTTGHLQRSRRYLQQALQLAPVQWPTYLEMARLDVLQHRYAEADEMAQHAMKCSPPAPAAVHYIDAEATFFLRQYDRSATQFKLFLAQAPKNSSMARARAAAQHDLDLLAQQGKIH
ncbi:MAG: carboxypeptidase regulatory-like domain-containing protein [Terriglobales bacterium]